MLRTAFLVIGRRRYVLLVVLLRTPVERRRIERVVFRRIGYLRLVERRILAGKRGCLAGNVLFVLWRPIWGNFEWGVSLRHEQDSNLGCEVFRGKGGFQSR